MGSAPPVKWTADVVGVESGVEAVKDALRAVVPRWVRMADAAAAALAALAIVVALGGGTRRIVFGVVLSLRSPLALLYVAGSLLIVRHLVVARPSVWTRLAHARAALAARHDLAAALGPFVATRLAVFLSALLAVSTIGIAISPGFVVSNDPLVNLPARFDAGWYSEIALDGYNWSSTFSEQRNIAFFPAMPLLMRGVGVVFGMNERGLPRERRLARVLWGGVIVSLAAFLWGLHYLVRLGRELVGAERAAAAALLLAAYPFSLFYSAAYTESLFLLAAVAAFFHFRRQEWVTASLWGLLAGITRPNGCFVSLPLAIIAAVQLHEHRHRTSAIGVPWRMAGVRLVSAAAPVAGMLIFTAYLHTLTGEWFAWTRSHAAWGRSFQGAAPLTGFFQRLHDEPLTEIVMNAPYDTLNALALMFALVLVWPVFRRLGFAWAAFVLINLLPPLVAGGVLSMGRFTSTLFPLFLTLALMIPSRAVPVWACGFAILQGLCAALFFTWRGLY